MSHTRAWVSSSSIIVQMKIEKDGYGVDPLKFTARVVCACCVYFGSLLAGPKGRIMGEGKGFLTFPSFFNLDPTTKAKPWWQVAASCFEFDLARVRS